MADYMELGRAAAQASLDAHGTRVDPTIAYDFITTMAMDGDDIETMATDDYPAWDALPMEVRINFLQGYYEGEAQS